VIEVRVKPFGGVQDKVLLPTGWLLKTPGPCKLVPLSLQFTNGTVPFVVIMTVPTGVGVGRGVAVGVGLGVGVAVGLGVGVAVGDGRGVGSGSGITDIAFISCR